MMKRGRLGVSGRGDSIKHLVRNILVSSNKATLAAYLGGKHKNMVRDGGGGDGKD